MMDGSPPRISEAGSLVDRMARAFVLAEALDRAEPHDADTLASAWVADHMTGGPAHTLGVRDHSTVIYGAAQARAMAARCEAPTD